MPIKRKNFMMIRNFNNHNSWQSKMGYVPQQVTLLNDSLFINLFIMKYTSDKIEHAKKCLRLADLENFVTRLKLILIRKLLTKKIFLMKIKNKDRYCKALIRNPNLLS